MRRKQLLTYGAAGTGVAALTGAVITWVVTKKGKSETVNKVTKVATAVLAVTAVGLGAAALATDDESGETRLIEHYEVEINDNELNELAIMENTEAIHDLRTNIEDLQKQISEM